MMSEVLNMAARLGLRVRIQYLGAAAHGIAAEYDPRSSTILVNARVLDGEGDGSAAVDACVAHELYHHLEYLDVVPRRLGREREALADAFARCSFRLGIDPAEIRARLRPVSRAAGGTERAG
ncbi:MAG: hypothetical protein KGM44_00570 [bacterium]|nr:hypothetical protein [bacterium]